MVRRTDSSPVGPKVPSRRGPLARVPGPSALPAVRTWTDTRGMNGIVVGLDTSPPSLGALRWALDHGARHAMAVTAVLGRDSNVGHDGSGRQSPEAMLAQLAPDIETIDVGGSRSALCAAAAEANLVVVGASPPGDGTRCPVGGVMEGLLHDARCPLAVVKQRSVDSSAPVIVGVDGSASSIAALRWAIADCLNSDRPLVAVHGWALDAPSSGHVITDDDADGFARVAAAHLDAILDDVGDPGIAIDSRVVYGPPAFALLDHDIEPALTVVGRDRSARGRELGSINGLVVAGAVGVVVVVPATGAMR